MAYFPFFVELTDKKCLITGGGMVAYRKALVLKDFGPEITVVAKEMIPEMEQLAAQCNGSMTLLKRGFEDTDIQDADFVIAATSDEELNRHISVSCRQQKIPVNVVDVQEECSFIFPALIKEEEIVVGISTGGSSPTIAQYLKKRFRQAIPSGFGMLAVQLGSYRELVKEKVSSLPVRTEIFKTMVKEGIRQGGIFTREQAIELIERKLGEHEQ
ncbi:MULTISPECIES: bifunctional precorrin-2 dehydrogenase/sirohydrochlorin ferrochelatase [Lacrimispora]|jgi:siroheme synthase-like protein|uniref:precorrin-2 dehydrogenase/sirohydrochlorin ferrochelatase family protein n=1 Tax=Lacrimispora TaxID=2719231 RepID=UPI000BE32382|nr:bifunctional precorrin-2 dehydrogenase/sirohydrochlorin ferrochelatase [Lacrimispora amygdalina]MDK2968360.1 precorrin-2 dehydrogenase [Lacrimispora sp.]